MTCGCNNFNYFSENQLTKFKLYAPNFFLSPEAPGVSSDAPERISVCRENKYLRVVAHKIHRRRRRRVRGPPNNRGKYFPVKYHVNYGHFANFSCIYFPWFAWLIKARSIACKRGRCCNNSIRPSLRLSK